MKPTFMQMFFAGNWPLKIWGTVVGVLSIFEACRACDPGFSSFRDWQFDILFGSVIVVAPVFGIYTTLFFVWLILGPIYMCRGRMNGAPYKAGDYVQVLIGKNRGRVFKVDRICESRGQVCLDVGEPRKKGVEFAFSHTQVFRVAPPTVVDSTLKDYGNES
jgi:hypothetical protein